MSHIHIPDGILPFWLWILGFVVIGFYLFFTAWYLKKNNCNKKLVFVGICSALMIISMSIEIAPISYHLNISALSGIILGPVLSPLAILVTNAFLALVGHGGVTVIGLNTIVVSIEAIIAYYIFTFLKNMIKKPFINAFIATFTALFVSCWLSIGVVYLGTGNLSENMHNEHEESNGLIRIEKPEKYNKTEEKASFDFKKFILLILLFGTIGWSIESIITAYIVNYISKIKPELLEN